MKLKNISGIGLFKNSIKIMMDLFLVQISIQLQVVKNNKIENQILLELKNFLIKNKNLSDNEIFSTIDKDCDGIINILFLNKF